MKSASKLQLSFFAFSAFAVAALFAYFAFAAPAVTFIPPTLSDNSTTGANWVYINLSSSEPSRGPRLQLHGFRAECERGLEPDGEEIYKNGKHK